jgi:hypothetical protein
VAAEDGVETQGELAEAFESEGILQLLMGDSAPVGEAPPPDDTGSAVEQPRDDKGRFQSAKVDDEPAAVETPETPEVPAQPAAEAEPAEAPADDDGDIVIEIDEDLEAVLERYDGDVGKALKALAEKESFTGRQANEIGQLRQELAQMRAAVEQGFQQPQQPQYFGPYQHDLDSPRELVYEALQRGDAQTMEVAIKAWGEEEPFEAATFLFSLQQQQVAQAYEQEPAPAAIAAIGGGESLEQAMADVVSRHPDVEKFLPGLGETAKEFPTLRNSMESGTPAQQAQAFEELLVITKTRAGASDTSSAVKRVILKTQEEVRKEKADAAVVSAQTRSAATAQPTGLDRFYEAFDEAAERFSPADWIARSND